MILLITRQDKCDPIFRRQLLSCFVSLRSLQRMDNNYSAQLNFSFVLFFHFLFSHKIKKEWNTSKRECNLSFCCLTILSKRELKKAFSLLLQFTGLQTGQRFQASGRIVTVYTRRARQDRWYLHCSTVILHVEHSRQRNQAPVCWLTSTTKDSDTVRVKLLGNERQSHFGDSLT